MVLGVLGRVAAVVAGAALVRAVVGAEGQPPRLPAAVRPPLGQHQVQPHAEGGVPRDGDTDMYRVTKVLGDKDYVEIKRRVASSILSLHLSSPTAQISS